LKTANQIQIFQPTFAKPIGPANTVRKAMNHCADIARPTPVWRWWRGIVSEMQMYYDS
jgi:hypothetical protein